MDAVIDKEGCFGKMMLMVLVAVLCDYIHIYVCVSVCMYICMNVYMYGYIYMCDGEEEGNRKYTKYVL